MSWFDEARQSLIGSWLLLIRDVSGYQQFNNTEAGFWRSFSAIVIVAPLYLYGASVQVQLPDSEAAASPSLIAAIIGLVLQWLGWPLAMAAIAYLTGLAHGYARYVIAYNWSSVLVIAALLPPLILLDLDWLSEGGALALSFIVLIGSLYYRWYVALTAFETSGAVAAALVLADVALSLGINRLVG